MAGRVIAILLAIAGLAVMATAALAQRDLLEKQELPADLKRQALWQPLTELLLGLVFTFGGLYFARRVFAGQQAGQLAYAIAAAIVALTAWGAYTRHRHFWQETSLGAPPEDSLPLQRRYCGGLALFLGGALLAAYLMLPL